MKSDSSGRRALTFAGKVSVVAAVSLLRIQAWGQAPSGDAATAVVDPRGPSSGRWRVVRGCGSWVAERNMRVARRDQTEPANRSPALGFRLVRSAE
jgi:hypothetical protein